VKRATAGAGPYATIGNPTGASYTDTAVTNGTVYYYVVSAISASGEGADSAPVNVTPGGTPPPAPSSLVATAGSNQVTLSWNASSGATGYNVKRATAAGGPYYAVVATVTTTNYTDGQAANFATYFYVASAVNSAGESADSAQVSATPFGSPPAPGGLSATWTNHAPVLVSWLGVFGATGYNVKRATSSGGPYTTIGSVGMTPDLSMSFSDATASAGGRYYYVVSALNAGGESANSSQASATVLVVLMVGSSGGGQFSLSFQAVSGQNYVIETSTNLADWVPVLTNTAASGMFNFIDTNATAPRLFYRARQ
jgi:cellulose 1,4-beta-cellobiosidase